ncbi:MAG: ABC transporter ATP-binding protein/permease [Oscillospiraceae bacterium]|nr:ABC transporter ATP-binding protein/permease [Oscillospiraceae bacterium]
MLQLKDIVKTYVMGDTRIEALRGVGIQFRKNDFVSILGPSGCGKTTMLNIIGGLDKYTSGDLVINGISTKDYKDVDWDIYRNNSIGFVFQSYNLISHQTVYTNVELALTLAGISPAERKKRVTEVLEKVGLGDQLHKKPTQMSGGQMQRVAIARALVNNPEILLADEPTGALDSATSVQIMELLKEIAKDRLVIMVTHNSDLAEKYSTRIIRLLDGSVISDTNPFTADEEAAKPTGKRKKISMSFPTALALSFKNLLTKKTRTILTAFAGSIGIIGIALILSLSSGMQLYVNDLERDTLSTYPLELQSQTMDMGGMMEIMMGNNRPDRSGRETDKVYANRIMTRMIESMTAQVQNNDLGLFREYLEGDGKRRIEDATNSIQYGYSVELQIFGADTENILRVNPSEMVTNLLYGGDFYGGMSSGMGGMAMGGVEIWSEMIDNTELLRAQYDVLAGRWPEAFNEVVLFVNDHNEVSDFELYALGLLDSAEFDELMKQAMRGGEITKTESETSFTYDDILSLTYKLLLNTDYYAREGGNWADKRDDDKHLKAALENALDLKIVGILRASERAAATAMGSTIGYTSDLTKYVIDAIQDTEIAKEQLADPDINILTGYAFDMDDYIDSLTMEDVYAALAELPEDERAQTQMMLGLLPEEQILSMFAEQMRANSTNATYEENLQAMGIVDFEKPSYIRLYPKDFDSKKTIETLIADYNRVHEDAGNEEYVISYTDIVGIMTSSISNIIDIVSYVLIAFVAISLVVSSIMIAIITYISVLERTKEIGILRSIGASKKDITRVFNAETVIEGFVAGTLGIVITILLNFPINAVIKSLTRISGISALPVWGAVGLIIISVVLTLIAGFIPSKIAAKKDPVEALRVE